MAATRHIWRLSRNMQVGAPEPYRAAKYAWELSPTTAGNSCEQRGHGTSHPPCKAGCHTAARGPELLVGRSGHSVCGGAGFAPCGGRRGRRGIGAGANLRSWRGRCDSSHRRRRLVSARFEVEIGTAGDGPVLVVTVLDLLIDAGRRLADANSAVHPTLLDLQRLP
jgi:hypothetical protein